MSPKRNKRGSDDDFTQSKGKPQAKAEAAAGVAGGQKKTVSKAAKRKAQGQLKQPGQAQPPPSHGPAGTLPPSDDSESEHADPNKTDAQKSQETQRTGSPPPKAKAKAKNKQKRRTEKGFGEEVDGLSQPQRGGRGRRGEDPLMIMAMQHGDGEKDDSPIPAGAARGFAAALMSSGESEETPSTAREKLTKITDTEKSPKSKRSDQVAEKQSKKDKGDREKESTEEELEEQKRKEELEEQKRQEELEEQKRQEELEEQKRQDELEEQKRKEEERKKKEQRKQEKKEQKRLEKEEKKKKKKRDQSHGEDEGSESGPASFRPEAEEKQAQLDEAAFDVAFEQAEIQENEAADTIQVDKLVVRVKGKTLLDKATLSITKGRRYVLYGPNGKGKSTLLKLLNRRRIPIPAAFDVLLVEQEVLGTDMSARDTVVAADKELIALRAEEQYLNGLPELSEKQGRRLAEVYESLEEHGSATAEGRAGKILSGLTFPIEWHSRPTSSFSGGWRMRISLARALFVEPSLLLLDEPTNHLDLRAVLWLETYLKKWKKTLVVVSHDREFLNTVGTDVIHLHDQKLYFYKGNFDQFEVMMEQKRREQNKAFEKYEKQLKAAKTAKHNAKQSATQVTDRAKKEQRQKEEKRGKKKAQMGLGDEDQEQAEVPKKWLDYQVKFEFPQPAEITPPLLSLTDVHFQYPTRSDFALDNINLGVDMGSRVAIVGPNGAGKSTLMKLLMGSLEPTSGQSRKSHRCRIGVYNQHFVDILQMEQNPVVYLRERFPESGLSAERMRAKLGKFGLAGHNHLQPISNLSGGQKARVVFASISLMEPHILLLDEPTNHLDMQSIDALADAIDEFTGGVIIISHDARLVSRICADEERSEVWVVENGTVRRYNGDFDDYRDELIQEIEADEEKS